MCKYCQEGNKTDCGDIEFAPLESVKRYSDDELLPVFKIIYRNGTYFLTNRYTNRIVKVNACPVCGRWFGKQK